MEGSSAPEAEVKKNPENEYVPKYGKTLVFGQGPVKLLKIASELLPSEKEIWDKFKANPKDVEEPDFYVINKDPGPEKRKEWQKMGKFALKRLGRLNALAAGYALLEGYTSELIFSGGRTTSSFTKPAVDSGIEIPSEAELMEDIVIRRFGEAYMKKYKKDIRGAIKTEDKATNTLENVVLTRNEYPELSTDSVGLLTSNHQMDRARLIVNIFGMTSAQQDQIKAQELLNKRAIASKKFDYAKMVETEFPEIERFTEGEGRMIKGLTEPELLEYWIGYAGELKDPEVLQDVLKKFQDKKWQDAIKETFKKVDLDFAKVSETDLVKLAQENPVEFENLRSKIAEFTLPGKRKVLQGPAIKR